jgi:hypothetical protein
VMADVLDAEVFQFEVSNSACLGAALRAYHAELVSEKVQVGGTRSPQASPIPCWRAASLRTPRASPCTRTEEALCACEAHALRGGDNPEPLIAELRDKFGWKSLQDGRLVVPLIRQLESTFRRGEDGLRRGAFSACGEPHKVFVKTR